MAVLEHHEMIYLARLLGNHLTGINTPLTRIADKLMGYAENTGEWDVHSATSLPPLNLEPPAKNYYGSRVMFQEKK